MKNNLEVAQILDIIGNMLYGAYMNTRVFSPYSSEIFLINHGDQRVLFLYKDSYRFYTSESDVYRRQIRTDKDGPNLTSIDVRTRILVQVTIYRKLLIGRDGHLDQSEAYDIS